MVEEHSLVLAILAAASFRTRLAALSLEEFVAVCSEMARHVVRLYTSRLDAKYFTVD